MANYYQNKLTVLHDSAERIEEVFAAIRTEDRDVIDFNAIIPRPERLNIDHDGMAEMAMLWMINRAMPHNLDNFAVMMAERFEKASEEVKKKQLEKASELFRNIADYGYPDFYRWSIDHWGTKWNSINGYSEMRRDGEAMFATDENFKLLQKMIRDNFGPDASMSYGKIDMHSFCDERPHMREVEVCLRDLDVMQPWIDEYLDRRKQSFDKERNKNKQED